MLCWKSSRHDWKTVDWDMKHQHKHNGIELRGKIFFLLLKFTCVLSLKVISRVLCLNAVFETLELVELLEL